jgi:hypothetical protein
VRIAAIGTAEVAVLNTSTASMQAVKRTFERGGYRILLSFSIPARTSDPIVANSGIAGAPETGSSFTDLLIC